MDITESEAKFDSLTSVTTLVLDQNLLTRVPSLKNMRSLRYLGLEINKITRIERGKPPRERVPNPAITPRANSWCAHVPPIRWDGGTFADAPAMVGLCASQALSLERQSCWWSIWQTTTLFLLRKRLSMTCVPCSSNPRISTQPTPMAQSGLSRCSASVCVIWRAGAMHKAALYRATAPSNAHAPHPGPFRVVSLASFAC